MVIWIFGQPGSGKSTLSQRLLDRKVFKNAMQIDGDNIRDVFENKDYSKEGRLKNGQFTVKLASFIENQGIDVIVSLVTPYQEIRDMAKVELRKVMFIELFYDAAEERRPSDRLVQDYEINTSACMKINTSEVGINQMGIIVEDELGRVGTSLAGI